MQRGGDARPGLSLLAVGSKATPQCRSGSKTFLLVPTELDAAAHAVVGAAAITSFFLGASLGGAFVTPGRASL